tara:strand:+ start:3914 stop:4402 length:489 start_codon:yes stop_codon:yes gene_type:complete
MKKIIIVRHAKSSWGYNVIDHERPLSGRGKNDAEQVSRYLISYNLSPELILSSDAVRAKTTAEIFMENLKFNGKIIQLNHDLYDFAGHNLLRIIKDCNDSIHTLMVFGHNYAITAFVNTYGNKPIDNVPTSGVVVIEFDMATWKNLKPGNTTLTVFPRDLGH